MLSLRRGVAVAAATMAACLVVTGCSTEADPAPAPSPRPSATASASPSPSGPVTLRFAVYGDATLRAAYRQIAAAYTARNPEVTVRVEGSAHVDDEMERLDREFAVGDGPDLFVSPSDRVPALARQERIQPVDKLLEERNVTFGDTYQRLGLEAFSADQALQCMPFDVSPVVVIYNQGLVPFRRLIEPGDKPLTPTTGWKWDQFVKAVRLMSRDGVNGLYVEPQLRNLQALAAAAGDDLVDDPRTATTLTLSDGDTRATMEQILDLLREPRFTPSAKQLRRVDGITRFARGQVGMIIATRAVVPRLRQATDLDFDVFPLPRISRTGTAADVTGFCLSAESTQQAAAADFLTFASGEDGARILAETGEVVPAHLPTLNSESFTQPGQQPESTAVFNEAIAKAEAPPYVPGWPQLGKALEPDLRRLFYAPVIDLDTLLPAMDEQSRTVLAPEPSPSE